MELNEINCKELFSFAFIVVDWPLNTEVVVTPLLLVVILYVIQYYFIYDYYYYCIGYTNYYPIE